MEDMGRACVVEDMGRVCVIAVRVFVMTCYEPELLVRSV